MRSGGASVDGPLAAAVLALLLAAGSVHATPSASGNRSILFLEWGEAGRPTWLAVMKGFRETLERDSPEHVAIHPLALDLERLPGTEHEDAIRDYLDGRFGERIFDAIVALGDPTVRCVLEWRQTRWPGVPLVAGVADPRLGRQIDGLPEATGFIVTIDVAGTLDAALALLPETKRVAWVAGNDRYLPAVERELANRRDRLEVIELVDLPFAETRRRMAALPEDTIVLYSALNRDGAGQVFTSRSALEQLAPLTSRPIFAYPGTYLGHGIVGGSMIDFEEVGRVAARLTLRVLAGESPSAIPVSEGDVNRLLFDGREMDRWRLEDARLPPGSRVLFRPRTLWEEHRTATLAGLLLFALQTAFIVALAVAMRRRRRAEKQLRRLSGRLLTVQEEERSRIAQELHDDVSQRLALLAIELDEESVRKTAPDEESAARLGALAAKARSLSTEVHQIAYELHPAILDQLGLVPALRQFADQVAARHGVTVEIVDTDWEAGLPRDVSLTLYRVAQEALQNAVKHSGASEIRIALRGSPRGVTLMVSDAGQGFDPAHLSTRRRLGLAGMEERLRLVGGQICVDSAPTKGTVVAAFIARPVLAARTEEESRRAEIAMGEGDEAPSPAR